MSECYTNTIRVGSGGMPRIVTFTALTRDREPIMWEPGPTGELIIPTTGHEQTIVQIQVKHDGPPGTLLTVHNLSFQGNQIPNKNHNVAFPAGVINTLPAVAFRGQINTDMSHDDIRKFIGAGSTMEIYLIWSKERQQQPVYRGSGGGGGGGGRRGLACFDASHIVPTITHQTRPIDLDTELEYLVPIYLQSKHRTQQAAQDEAKRKMLACVDGVVPIVDKPSEPVFR